VKVAVVGAGAFGGWTALELQRRGASVTLLDAWGPGHPRSGSGGDTRVLRVAYGPHEIYTRLALRARERWIEHERLWNRPLFRRTGAVWFADHEDSYQQAFVARLRESGAACEEWTATELGRRYPQINVEGIRWALFEPDAGYLWARDACARVVEALEAAGGEYRRFARSRTACGAGAFRP
jgi:glycine/D-amino acid oxidase-like deaminating enzyme